MDTPILLYKADETAINKQTTSQRSLHNTSSNSCCRIIRRIQNCNLLPLKPISRSRMANATSGVPVSEECSKVFQELRAGRAHRFVVFKMDDAVQQVVVEKVGGRDATFEDLAASLPAGDCRYAVYDLDFTVGDAATPSGDAPRSKIFFISWSPAAADVKSKMVYASSNEGFKKELDGVQMDVQATEPSELTLDILKDQAS